VLAHYRGNFFVAYRLLPSSQMNFASQLFYILTRFGEEPVLIFFVLSGFLVGGRSIKGILENKIEATAYFIDRFVRILLPLIASSLLVVVIDLFTNTPVPFKDIAGSLFSLQGVLTNSNHNVPLWSLTYEVWFYMLIGSFIVLIRENGLAKLVALLFIILSLYIFSILNFLYLIILLIGTCSYLLKKNNIKFKKIKIITLLFFLGISFFLLQSTTESKSIDLSYLNFINRNFSSLFLAVVTALLICILTVSPPKSNLGIKIDGLGYSLSNFSYTLYLTHWPLMKLLSFLGFPKSIELNFVSIAYYIFSIMISLLVAYSIYLVSEKQTNKVKGYIKQKLIKSIVV
jgi:peptidoglycan/LPS O-acetylase OafA/YrhL